jgi:hypothetical protein
MNIMNELINGHIVTLNNGSEIFIDENEFKLNYTINKEWEQRTLSDNEVLSLLKLNI